MKQQILTLAIESSCDETSAAVVRNGREVLSNIISSQIDVHKVFGGVVPEIAARAHVERLAPMIEAVLADAGVALTDLENALNTTT